MHCVSRKTVLRAYFLATASIFEPDRAIERLGWTKTVVLANAVTLYLQSESRIEEARQNFIYDFHNGHTR